jgi:hypothetical protein
MDREDIIELANKAHAYIDRHFLVASSTGIASFEHFARLVAEREREECAKVCDEEGLHITASIIRARGKE